MSATIMTTELFRQSSLCIKIRNRLILLLGLRLPKRYGNGWRYGALLCIGLNNTLNQLKY